MKNLKSSQKNMQTTNLKNTQYNRKVIIMFIFFIGMCMTIVGVAGIEGTIPLWQGFLISFSGLVVMFISIIVMSYQGSEYID